MSWQLVSSPRSTVRRSVVLVLATVLGSTAVGCAATPSPGAVDSHASPSAPPSEQFGGGPAAGSRPQSALPEWAGSLLAGSPASDWRTRSVGADVVVVGGMATGTAQIARLALAARAVVDREWGSPWSRRVLVIAPANRAELAAVAGVTPDRLTAAAMTVTRPGKGSYVLLDPTSWERATPAGRRVLLVHEIVHVAQSETSAAGDSTGSLSAGHDTGWLSEGFAQEVAYRDIGAKPRGIAPGLLERIARDGPPAQLPRPADLHADSVAREDAYALSWLAVRTLRRLAGPDATRRAVLAGSVQEAGITPQGLLRAWQEDLRRLAAQR